MKEKNQTNDRLTTAGTDIEKVKRLNKDSGLSYNEAKEWIAKNSGGHGTDIYSDTDVEAIKANQSRGKHH